MERLGIVILGLSEVRWTGSGKEQIGKDIMIYYGGEKHERGVAIIVSNTLKHNIIGYWAISDRVILVKFDNKHFNMSVIQVYAATQDATEEELEEFYDQLDKARRHCKSQEVIIVMGDLNAKIGKGKEQDIVGEYGLGERNARGDTCLDRCIRHNQVITNTWFKQHPKNLWTWKSPGDRVRNQIDYITINKRFRNAVTLARSYPGADCHSDHVPVVATFKLKLKILKKP